MDTRRHFLQKVASPFFVLPLVPAMAPARPVSEEQPQDGKVLRIALMGLGGYASIVARAVSSCTRTKLVGLVSGTPAKLKDWQQKYNIPEKNCYNYQNFDEIRNNSDIDAVYVTTPNGLHHDHVIGAAKAGKQVICEKPMALNARQGQEMVDACKKAGVHLLVGYRMHFEPNTLEVIRMRKAGELGRIRFFQGLTGFKIGDPKQWRLNKALAGGGSLMDIGLYSVNGARYMIGEEPIWVTAQETKTDKELFKDGVDETIQFQMGFPSGAVASCLSTYNMNNLDRFFLTGDDGFAELYPAAGYGPIKGRTNKGELNGPETVHQAVQLDNMAGIIFEGAAPVVPVNGEEGVRDLKIIDAIYEAVRTGKKIMLQLS